MQQIYFQRITEAIRAPLDAFFSLGTLDSISETKSPDAEGLLAEVEIALVSNSYGAKFSHIVEERFKRATAGPRGRLFIRAAIVGTIIYDLFLFVDFYAVPDVMWLAVTMQIGILTPITIAIIFAIWRFRIDPEIPTFVCLASMMAATIIIFAASRSPHVDLFACVFGLFVVAGNVGLAIGFGSALIFSTMSLLSVSTAIVLHPSLDMSAQVFSIALLLAFTTYSLAGSYRIEAGVRTAYLFALRESLHARLLDVSNMKLTSLITVDGLTGIGNRRLFDECLATRWREPTSLAPLALLLIDIDHFKKVNDDHGHLTGDECLRCVAQALAREVSSETMTLARFGGEEFAIVIADATSVEMTAFAERLRRHVMTLSIETKSRAVLCVTVSIGCAAAVPSDFNTPAELIGAADAALYKAKRTGRNRVEIAELTPFSIGIDRANDDLSVHRKSLRSL